VNQEFSRGSADKPVLMVINRNSPHIGKRANPRLGFMPPRLRKSRLREREDLAVLQSARLRTLPTVAMEERSTNSFIRGPVDDGQRIEVAKRPRMWL
jgi:hypothetical protein